MRLCITAGLNLFQYTFICTAVHATVREKLKTFWKNDANYMPDHHVLRK